MATVSDFVQTITQYMGPLAHAYNSAAKVYDLFEAYVFSLIVEAAINEGATVQMRQHGPNQAAGLVFRTSPGRIYSTTHTYTYAFVDFGNNIPPLEVHLGIYVAGKSDVPHECDVVVIDAQEADLARQGQVHPRCTKVCIAGECKYYTTPLGLSLGRSFLGLSEELNCGLVSFLSNMTAPTLDKIFKAHRREWQHGLEPTELQVENRFRSQLEEWFKKYKVQ